MGHIVALKPASLQWSPDGSVENLDYRDVYFQRGRGLAESRYVFIEKNGLPQRMRNTARFSIAELGFGTGMNFHLVAGLFIENAPADACLDYVSFEKHPVRAGDLRRIYDLWRNDPVHGADFTQSLPFLDDFLERQPAMVQGFHTILFAEGRIRLTLVYGDAGEMLPQVSGRFDCWFLDGFTPRLNPDMWQHDLYPHMFARTKEGGTLSSFSGSRHVREGLTIAGFDVMRDKGFGTKLYMTTARKNVPDNKPAVRPERSYHIAIIGSGIAAASAAAQLAARGHKVTVVEKAATIAAGASGNPLAAVYPKLTADPSPASRFYLSAFSAARAMLLSLGGHQLWWSCGVKHLATDAEDVLRHRKIIENIGLYADTAEISGDAGDLLHPLAGTVAPQQLCLRLLVHRNIEILLNQNVHMLQRQHDMWTLCDDTGRSLLAADKVIIASGVKAAQYAQTAFLPLQPVRGQLTYLRESAQSAHIETVRCGDGYILPAQNGMHVTGATFEKCDMAAADITDVTEAAHEVNLRKTAVLAGKGIFDTADVCGGRTSCRATTPDKLPYVGPVPDFDASVNVFAGLRQGLEPPADTPMPCHNGLYVMAGFGSHGMTTATLSAMIVAAMVDDAPLPIENDLLPYVLPERVILRGLRRRVL